MALNISELKGTELKKVINAQRVMKRYHNKNNSGGNFGIDIRLQNGDYYELGGNHNIKGEIWSLHFGKGYGLGAKIVRKDNYQTFTFNDLKGIMQSQMGIAQAPAKKVVTDRNKDAVVSNIGGISFVDFTVGSKVTSFSGNPDGMEEMRAKAKRIVKEKAENLKNQGIKRIEFDSYGGYSFRNVPNKGRFFPITTMHVLRLMKR
jgi:hypothetical protein